MRMEPNDLVAVRFYDDPMEAHLGRCLLQNEGIEAYVNDEYFIGLNRALGVALGGVKLKVAETDKEQALLILHETEHRPYLDEDDQPIKCPKCGSEELTNGVSKLRTKSDIFYWGLALLFAVYPISMDRSMRCDKCGHFFRPLP